MCEYLLQDVLIYKTFYSMPPVQYCSCTGCLHLQNWLQIVLIFNTFYISWCPHLQYGIIQFAHLQYLLQYAFTDNNVTGSPHVQYLYRVSSLTRTIPFTVHGVLTLTLPVTGCYYSQFLLQGCCAADFSLLNLPKGKSLGRSKPATNS